MFKFKNLMVIFVLLFCSVSFLGCDSNGYKQNAGKQNFGEPICVGICTCFEGIVPINEKVIWDGTANGPFYGNSVIIVMDRNFSRPNISPNKCFFRGIEIEYIRDLTAPIDPNSLQINWETWNQILLIRLSTNCTENVIRVIRQIEKIDGIMSVEPSFICQGAIRG